EGGTRTQQNGGRLSAAPERSPRAAPGPWRCWPGGSKWARFRARWGPAFSICLFIGVRPFSESMFAISTGRWKCNMTGRSWQSSPRNPRENNRRPPFRPRLESLEDLVLPSGITMVPTHLLAGHPIVSPQAGTGTPAGLSPAQVRHAYGFDQVSFSNGTVKADGSGQTIAIVD